MHFLYVTIISVIIYLIYLGIKKVISRSFTLKDTEIDTPLKEFRESRAVSKTISSGVLDIKESIVQRYERMCIIDPVKYKSDPSIPQLIKDYQGYISGRVLDPQGRNMPSEEILGTHNPDYYRYITNQAKAMKKVFMAESSEALTAEKYRLVRVRKEHQMRVQMLSSLVMRGLPPLLVGAALTDGKLNTYTAEDWKKFSKVVMGYIEVGGRNAAQEFVKLFDDKDIIFNTSKFDNFVIFFNYKIPEVILTEIIKDRITVDQAIRMVSLVQGSQYAWDDAMEEVIKEDLKQSETKNLHKEYGWKGDLS